MTNEMYLYLEILIFDSLMSLFFYFLIIISGFKWLNLRRHIEAYIKKGTKLSKTNSNSRCLQSGAPLYGLHLIVKMD